MRPGPPGRPERHPPWRPYRPERRSHRPEQCPYEPERRPWRPYRPREGGRSSGLTRDGLTRDRAVRRRYQPARGGRRVRRHGEGPGQGLPDPAAPAPSREVEPVEVGGRAHRRADIAREGEADLGRGVRVRQPDLVQRYRPPQLRADGGGDEMRGRALRHHALGHPPGDRGLVIPERQSALRPQVVDPPGQPRVADAREGEDGAELLVRLTELPGHAPPLVTHVERRPSSGHRRPAT